MTRWVKCVSTKRGRGSNFRVHFMGYSLCPVWVRIWVTPVFTKWGPAKKVTESKRKPPLSGWKAVVLWLREEDLNLRPPGYELRPDTQTAAPQCFPGLFGPEIPKTRRSFLSAPRRLSIFWVTFWVRISRGGTSKNCAAVKNNSRLSEKGVKRSGSSVRVLREPNVAACEGLCEALAERAAPGALRRSRAVCGLCARLESGDGPSPAGPLRAEESRF